MTTSQIPQDVLKLLEETRYGVSFPYPSGCQMRFMHNGVDLGDYYSYRAHGGIKEAVKAAIAKNVELRGRYRRSPKGRPIYRFHSRPHGSTGVVGVSGAKYHDSRRDIWAYRYQVSWRKNHRPMSKTFHLSDDCSPDQMLHAFRTATQFRAEWESTLDEFDHVRFQQWRVRRLYEPGQPLLPEGFWASAI